MDDLSPANARPVARVLLSGPDQKLLLLQADDETGHQWWVTPGGGLEPGESFEQAARRELREETGRRWWRLEELVAASEDFAPRCLPELWSNVVRGEYPSRPIDCGI